MARRRRAQRKDQGRCVIYARFSSSRQREESIEDQERVCRAYADAHGMEVVGTYEDRAASARSDDRPGFQRMVREAPGGSWGVVLVYKLDRFARDRFDAANYRVRLRDAGVELVSATEQIPDAPEGAILESVLEGVNEWYSRSLSQNVTRGMMGNARKCMANGVRVFGYGVGADGRYVVDEREAAIVRRAFAMAAAGSTRGEVMLWLNSVCTNVRGGQWRYPSVATLLSNEKYLGVYSFGGVRVEGGMPAIVDREVFDAANRPRPHARVGAFPLTGRLFDAETGTPYRGDGGTSGTGRRYFYYTCPLESGTVRYPQAEVEGAVEDAIRRAVSRPGQAEALADALLDAMEGMSDAAALDDARRRLAEAETTRKRLVDAIVSGVDPALVRDRLDAAGADARRLAAEVARLERVTAPDRGWLVSWLRQRFPADLTKRELRRTVGRCEIGADGTLTVEMPWSTSEDARIKKSSELPGGGKFRGTKFGGRYKI